MLREPTLGDVILDFWAAKAWLLSGVVIGLLGAFIFLSVAVPQYRASVIVSPSSLEAATAFPSVLPDNAGFALENLFRSFNPSESADFMRFESLVREQTVAARLLEDPDIVNGLENARRYKAGLWMPPRSPAELSRWLKDHLVINPVRETALRELTLYHPSPVFGPYMLGRIHHIADSHIREEQRQQTEKRISWLRERLDKTAHPEHRKVLTRLLMDQEQKAMLLAIEEPYAAQITEPPAASATPQWPERWLVIAVCVFAGLFTGYALYSLRRSARNRHNEARRTSPHSVPDLNTAP